MLVRCEKALRYISLGNSTMNRSQISTHTFFGVPQWVLFVFLFFLLHAGYAESSPGDFRVGYQENRLSVSATNAELARVLEEVSKKCLIEISISNLRGREVSVAFQDLSLEAGLAKLLSGVNYSFVCGATRAGQSEISLQKVIVFDESRSPDPNLIPNSSRVRASRAESPNDPIAESTPVQEPPLSSDQGVPAIPVEGLPQDMERKLKGTQAHVSEMMDVLKQSGWENNMNFQEALEKLKKEMGAAEQTTPQ